MNLEDFIELTIMHKRCSICDEIYESVTEVREGVCEICNTEIDLALKDFEEKDNEEN